MTEQTTFAPCPKRKQCGGCQLMHLPYARQLERKQARLEGLLGRFGPVAPIAGMARPYHYRGKVQAAFGVDGRGRIISGVYQSGSHRIVCVDDCLLEDETADAIIVSIRRMMPKFKMTAYDERRGRGFLRHVLVRRSASTGEVMVVLVATEARFPLQKPFLAALLDAHPEITTVVLNINDAFTPLVLGKREKTLFGPGFIEDELCALRFRISPASFYQVNPAQTELLYRTAIGFAALTGRERVLDAYCGTGTIGLAAAGSAESVAGVELNRDAVRDAIANARRNGIRNAWFTCADAGQFMAQCAREGERCDVVFMDPPRAGASAEFLESLLLLGPQRVVYVSCNPETLARDLGRLTRGGYRAERIQPVDMFPHTEHVETVCLLSKLHTKQHIEVEIDLDELDATSAETKATYDEIKAWVWEHHHLKVSSLYISQVKHKCGIIERECYNKPKSENSKVPVCPKEKEDAIMEALRAFQMI